MSTVDVGDESSLDSHAVNAGPTRRRPLHRKVGYLISLAAFTAKGICAFAITYVLANNLSVVEFGLWATMFSIGSVLGVSELGVGQLILTTFHERRVWDEDADQLVSNAVAAMVVLALVVLLMTSVIFSWQHVLAAVRWRFPLLAIILLRLVAVPYGAYLSALERYHERRLAEAASYGLGAGFIYWGVVTGADLSTLLLGMNAILTLGSLALIARARRLGFARVSPRTISLGRIRRVFGDSFPYFVSNVSTLVTYGAFIALSSLILTAAEVGRLSLLHGLLLMHTYQVFELVFRSVQPRMQDESLMRRLAQLVGVAYAGGLVVASLAGARLMALLFRSYTFSGWELALYTTFVFLEVYYLLLTSSMQMRSAMKHRLQWMSVVKAAAFSGVLIAASILSDAPGIALFTGLLTIYSATMTYAAWRINSRDVSVGFERSLADARDGDDARIQLNPPS